MDLDSHNARAALEWQIEMGVTEAIGAEPINRYALEAKPAKPLPAPGVAPKPAQANPVGDAEKAALAATTLESLKAAMAAYPHCDLRNGARNLVFSDGNPGAPVMIIGEAPGRDEDLQGKPFVGQAGQLLDKMFAAIGMARGLTDVENAIYITNVLPWRPPQNRDPKPDEVAMMLPFLRRHVELVNPRIVILMGNHACRAALGKAGITRLRGTWTTAFERPALPMCHPAYLLRTTHAKREAWADLLSLRERLST